jgi:hypothetical protein
MGELMELDRTGDTRLQWDPNEKDQVEAAKKKFAELKAKGYRGFSVNKKGTKGDILDDFDPHEERILMVPQMVGG